MDLLSRLNQNVVIQVGRASFLHMFNVEMDPDTGSFELLKGISRFRQAVHLGFEPLAKCWASAL